MFPSYTIPVADVYPLSNLYVCAYTYPTTHIHTYESSYSDHRASYSHSHTYTRTYSNAKTYTYSNSSANRYLRLFVARGDLWVDG